MVAVEPDGSTDADVARSVAGGGAAAAEAEEELCRRFLNRARLYGLRHLRFDVTAAEDLAQQVMMSVLEALRAGRVEEVDKIDRFVLGTCRNVAHSMRRRATRAASIEKRLTRELGHAVTPPWELVATRRVEECLAELPLRDSKLLFLLYQEDAEAVEAAEALGTTPGNIRVLRHRAIGRLRACVDRPREAPGP